MRCDVADLDMHESLGNVNFLSTYQEFAKSAEADYTLFNDESEKVMNVLKTYLSVNFS